MKKIILVVLTLILTATVANAASINGDVDGRPIVKLAVDGQELTFDGMPAMIYNGNTLIPVNALRLMGFEFTWDAATYTVTVVPPPPIIIKVPSGTTKEGTPEQPIDITAPTGTTGSTEQPLAGEPTPTPTPTPTVTPTPTLTNAAVCKAIRDNYTIQIFNIDNTRPMGADWKITQLKNQRDAELAAAGC